MTPPPLPRFRRAEVVQAIRIEVAEGSGVPGDPVREVVYYVALDGTVIAKRDAWAEADAAEGDE